MSGFAVVVIKMSHPIRGFVQHTEILIDSKKSALHNKHFYNFMQLNWINISDQSKK